VAWLSLDEGDNDPTRFWRYVVAALRTLPVLDGHPIGEALLAPQETHALPDIVSSLASPPSLHSLLADLINELDVGLAGLDGPAILALDDLHAVREPQIHDGLAYLLQHLPEQMRLVVCTRADPPWPLARARSRQALVELRARELRFSAGQVAVLLNEVHHLDLESAEIDTLNARTEGWVTGLQMAALAMQAYSLRERTDKAGFVEAFSGSQRFVLDYLVEEVLEQQPDEVQDFLLQTSILERMCAPLCDAVRFGPAKSPSSSDGTASQALLERLERDNLFVVPLDGERRWYRYHHLFADLLRRRLEAYPERVRAAHRAASGWFEGQGLAVEAISHALAAGDDERASILIEAQVPDILTRGGATRIRRWLEALPESRIRASPVLCVAQAWTLHGHAPVETIAAWLRQAESSLESASLRVRAETRNIVRSNIALLKATSARGQNAPLETQLALLQQAQRVVPESDLALRSRITVLLGLCYMDAGDEEAAERAFKEVWQSGLAGDSHWAALVAVYARTIIARWHGQLQRAAALCREALDTMDRALPGAPSLSPYRSGLCIVLGRILLEWHDLSGAERCLSEGLDGRAPSSVSEIVIKGRFARARLQLALGQVSEVPALSTLAPAFLGELVSYAEALEAQLYLMSAARAPNHPQSANWRQRAAEWATHRRLVADREHWPIVEHLIRARVQIEQFRVGAHKDLGPVLAFLDAQAPLLKARDWIELLVQTWIVRAMALQALRRERAALDALERALQLAAPGGYKQVFLDEGAPMVQLLRLAAERGIEAARSLLAAEPRGTTAHALLDPLSARELDVLRMLESERSQSEIARELYISVNTVRSHVKHIYDKLDVHARHEAIDRARELGVL
jgi:LuxR family maltose regulon positive regulatory protein